MIDQFNSIFIEFCTCCDKHDCTCQSTGPSKYTHYFNLLKLAIENLMMGFQVYANTNPLSNFLIEFLGLIFIKAGKQYAPTVGAFEVFYRGNLIFSKIAKKIWPSVPSLVKRIMSIKENLDLIEERAPPSRSTNRNMRIVTRPRTTQGHMPLITNLTLNSSPLNSTLPHLHLAPQSVDGAASYIYEDEQQTVKSVNRPRRINFSSDHADKHNKSLERQSPDPNNTLDNRYLIRPTYHKKAPKRLPTKNHGALDMITIADRRYKQQALRGSTQGDSDLSLVNNSFYYPMSEIRPISNQRARTPWSVFNDNEENNNLFPKASHTKTNFSEWDRPDGYAPETINTRLTLSRGGERERKFSAKGRPLEGAKGRPLEGAKKRPTVSEVKIPQIEKNGVFKRNPTIPESTQRGREQDSTYRGNLSLSITSRVRNGSISDMPFPKNKVSFLKIPRDEVVKKKITITGESGGDAMIKIYTDVPEIINMETNEVKVPKGGVSKVSLRFYNQTGYRPQSFNLFLFKNGNPYQKIVIHVEYL